MLYNFIVFLVFLRTLSEIKKTCLPFKDLLPYYTNVLDTTRRWLERVWEN